MTYDECPPTVKLAIDVARKHPLVADFDAAIVSLSRAIALQMPPGKSINPVALRRLYWTGVLANKKIACTL